DPVDRADVVLVGDRGGGLLQTPQVRGKPARSGRRVEDDLGAGQAQGPPAFWEVPVVADVHADTADGRVEYRVAEVAWAEVELLPEPLDLRKMVLPVLPEVLPVGVDDRRRVVVQPRLLFLVHRRDDHHAVLPGDLLQEP